MAVGETGNSGDLRTNYLNLLITQLQNQNPLEPMDNNQMSMQLAQLSQLEQLENMSNSFQKTLLVEQVDQASGLLGKKVTYFVEGETEPRSGVVSKVVLIKGQPVLGVGDDAVDPSDVVAIETAPPAAATNSGTTNGSTNTDSSDDADSTTDQDSETSGSDSSQQQTALGTEASQQYAMVDPAAAAQAYAESISDPFAASSGPVSATQA